MTAKKTRASQKRQKSAESQSRTKQKAKARKKLVFFDSFFRILPKSPVFRFVFLCGILCFCALSGFVGYCYFTLPDSDKKMFSREGYECKDLLQGRAGLPVVVSQKQDKDFPIWKVQYGFSCLVFPTYEDAMDFCRDRFTRLDGKAV